MGRLVVTAGKLNPNFFHRPEDHKNALHVASEYGHLKCVETLLKFGAVVDTVAITKQDTALTLASQSDKPEVVRLLLSHHANPNAGMNISNASPLTRMSFDMNALDILYFFHSKLLREYCAS